MLRTITRVDIMCTLVIIISLGACALYERVDQVAQVATEEYEDPDNYVSGEPPPLLDDIQYADALQRARAGNLDGATRLVGFIEYERGVLGLELTESRMRDRALGYMVMAKHGGICDSAAQIEQNEDISSYLNENDISVIKQINILCDGRSGYVNLEDREWSDLPFDGSVTVSR